MSEYVVGDIVHLVKVLHRRAHFDLAPMECIALYQEAEEAERRGRVRGGYGYIVQRAEVTVSQYNLL